MWPACVNWSDSCRHDWCVGGRSLVAASAASAAKTLCYSDHQWQSAQRPARNSRSDDRSEARKYPTLETQHDRTRILIVDDHPLLHEGRHTLFMLPPAFSPFSPACGVGNGVQGVYPVFLHPHLTPRSVDLGFAHSYHVRPRAEFLSFCSAKPSRITASSRSWEAAVWESSTRQRTLS